MNDACQTHGVEITWHTETGGPDSPMPDEWRWVEVDTGRLSITIMSIGATLWDVRYPDRSGDRAVNLTKTLPSIEDYVDPAINKGYGSTIGRYANRIAGAAYEIDGVRHEVVANEGPNQLHGGPDHFGFRQWELSEIAPGVRATLVSPDGDQGHPGRLDVTLDVVVEPDAFELRYSATSDAPTVVNLTNHAYWNLAGSDDARGHELSVAADRAVMVDGASIPTEIVDVDGAFDLRAPVPLSERPDGFDHCFVGRELTAVLREPSSGRRMTVSTDQPGLQVYTANFADPPYSAVCLEAQLLPDTPNRPDFGSAVLRPGATYTQVTRHDFGVG